MVATPDAGEVRSSAEEPGKFHVIPDHVMAKVRVKVSFFPQIYIQVIKVLQEVLSFHRCVLQVPICVFGYIYFAKKKTTEFRSFKCFLHRLEKDLSLQTFLWNKSKFEMQEVI